MIVAMLFRPALEAPIRTCHTKASINKDAGRCEQKRRPAIDTARPASLAELQGGKAPVNAVWHGLQFLVCAGFHNPSAGDDNDSVHMPNGREAVGDDKRSAPLHQGFERLLNQAFAFRIQ